eukprot:TRINITY_DN113016_c0_g1_i1.p1 TRINITY_DN113016_c0_g1~~TRINITY_DN113016_c0_g1_i1.p1  ORF type:complete len:457 (-),score=3.57 TRINITY_DN113016_c0_g1_i1:74-1423(-)
MKEAENPCLMLQIPLDTLVVVFSFLTPYDLWNKIATLSSKFHETVQLPRVWPVLDLSPYSKDQFTARNLITEFANRECYSALRELNLYCCPISEGGIDAFATHCGTSLQKINLAFCGRDRDLGDEELIILGEKCPNLHSINVEGCTGVTDEGLAALGELKLQSLNVSHCRGVSDRGMCCLTNIASLTELNIDGCSQIESATIQHLVQHSPKMKKILLDGADLEDPPLEAALALWSDTLTYLSVSFCDCLTDSILPFASACTQLEYLQLRKCKFTPVPLHTFFSSPTVRLPLTSLLIGECHQLDDFGCIALASQCPALTELDISWAWEVRDAGMHAILRGCRQLKELTCTGMKSLSDLAFSTVTVPPTLTILRLTQCNSITTDCIVASIIAHVPNCVVTDYYGTEYSIHNLPPMEEAKINEVREKLQKAIAAGIKTTVPPVVLNVAQATQ